MDMLSGPPDAERKATRSRAGGKKPRRKRRLKAFRCRLALLSVLQVACEIEKVLQAAVKLWQAIKSLVW